MPQIIQFPHDQYLILKYLSGSKKSFIYLEELIDELKIDQVFISAAVQTLNSIGLLDVAEENLIEIKLGKEGELFLETGLPEKIVIKKLAEEGKDLHINELSQKTGLEQKIIGKLIKVLTDKNWVSKSGANLTLTPEGKQALNKEEADEQLFKLLKEKKVILIEQEEKQYPFLRAGYELLKNRPQFLQIKERTKKKTTLNNKGLKTVQNGIQELAEATQLTSELLKDGKWKEIKFKSYDIKAESQNIYPGKIHPFQRILNETRKVYLEMGFTETSSSHVETSFWDFDALFQPQDHPARDMQDTFYMKTPRTAELPSKPLVEEVRSTHENGGKTGSYGWRYKWNLELAKKVVLRTHTTAASIQQLHRTPDKPLKVFCIGKVFRRETVDYKHLPVFTQVDGIIMDKNASLAHLIGLLKEFYKKMGFDQIEVRPAFFPYTEPSLEVFVYMEKKKDWVEMGGAGIFRKEVTLPMGADMPVLAWGLGLERLAMFKYNLTDIRDIYIANIKWLKEVSSCQL